MKKVLLLTVALFVMATASAQQEVGSITLLPKVGFNLANYSGDIDGNSMRFGLVAGAEVMYQVSDLVGVSGGLLYSMQGCNGEGSLKEPVDEINIPLLAHFFVAPNLALKVGLQPGIIASAKQKYEKQSVDIKDNLQTLEICVPLGISYDISDFVIGARYNLGISKINKGDGSIRNSVFQITLGYKIPLQ